jgi:hypothetical protein
MNPVHDLVLSQTVLPIPSENANMVKIVAQKVQQLFFNGNELGFGFYGSDIPFHRMCLRFVYLG